MTGTSKPAGLGRLANAARYSLDGLKAGLTEPAFRMELALALVLAPLGILLGTTGAERALLAGSVFLVLIVELLNSALEAAIDRISPDLHELSKRAKDLGSAAVMLSLANLGLVWLFVLLD